MSKRKLLLADDSMTIQKVVNLTFADEGIEVITVGDGDSAMQKIAEMAPDVVLADVHMPGLNGYQVCEAVRANPETREIPVVLLVGSFEPFDEAEAARVGANAYLTKPFQSIRQLVSQVSDLMQGIPQDSDAAADDDDDELASSDAQDDAGDIESLYQRSVSESAAEESEDAAPQYVDAGMDDEMIETSHADESESAASRSGHDFEEDQTDYAAYRRENVRHSPFDAPATSDSIAAVATAKDQSGSELDRFARTEQMPAPVADAPTEETFDLDEIELLELPPIDTARTIEFTTTQRSMIEGGKQVVSLSPQLMEVVVAKVVERLSEKD